MYNMVILIFGYKLNLEILILIGVVYLILVGHTICGTCNVPKIMERLQMIDGSDIIEGFKMKFSKKKGKSPSAGAVAAASAAALAQKAEQDKAAEDAAFLEALFKIYNIQPNDPRRTQGIDRLLKIPRDERDAFLKMNIENKDQQEARDAQEKAREAENAALRAKYIAAEEAFFKEASKIMGWSPDDPDRVQFEGRNRHLSPDKQAEVLIVLSKQKPRQDVNSLAVSYSKKEGFTGCKY